MSERQVRRWALAERWKGRLEAAQRKATALIVDRTANRLARMALRHRKVARAVQRRAQALIEIGVEVIGRETGKPRSGRGTNSTVVFTTRPLLPGELNQAAQAFLKAADLEYGLAGGKIGAAASETARPFPDLTSTMERETTGGPAP